MSGLNSQLESDAADEGTITRAAHRRGLDHTHVDWVCPECGHEYVSPVPVLAVTCGHVLRHARNRKVSAVPAP